MTGRTFVHRCLVIAIVALVLTGCGAPTGVESTTAAPAGGEATVSVPTEPSAPTVAPATEAPPMRVVLIGNQRFGDMGPMDQMARGLEQCSTDYGLETKKVESLNAGAFEEDIRGMAREGYDLIITTFPPMSEAQVAAAAAFPDVKFAAIYQFINAEESKAANVWSTEYRAQEATYIIGAFASQLSETKQLGFLSGQETSSSSNIVNGFLLGVQQNCPECSVEFAFTGSYEDPATGKEMAKALIGRGVDFIQTGTGKTQLGIQEAAKEAGIFFSGDNGDNSSLYPEGTTSYFATDFGANVLLACKYLVEGNFPGGTHSYMTYSNGGAIVPWDVLERFVAQAQSTAYADNATEALALARSVADKIGAGTLEVPFNPLTPQSVKPSQ